MTQQCPDCQGTGSGQQKVPGGYIPQCARCKGVGTIWVEPPPITDPEWKSCPVLCKFCENEQPMSLFQFNSVFLLLCVSCGGPHQLPRIGESDAPR